MFRQSRPSAPVAASAAVVIPHVVRFRMLKSAPLIPDSFISLLSARLTRWGQRSGDGKHWSGSRTEQVLADWTDHTAGVRTVYVLRVDFLPCHHNTVSHLIMVNSWLF